MNLAGIIFIVIGIVTVAGALVTVLSRSLIYTMIGLVTTMFGIAGLYIYLNAPFIAMMQILIYVGAITILIVFAIMIASPRHLHHRMQNGWHSVTRLAGALCVSLVSLVVFVKILMTLPRIKEGPFPFMITTKDIGRLFLDTLTFPFELISLLIVVSIVGAIMLAIFSKEER